MEARRLRPLIQPHCPRRNQCSPILQRNPLRIAGKLNYTLVAFIIHFMGKILAMKR